MNFIISMVHKQITTGEKQSFLRILHSEDWTTEDIAFASFSKLLKSNSLKVENAVIAKNKLHLINFKDSLPELTIGSDGNVLAHPTQYVLIAKVMSDGVLVGYVLTDSEGAVFTIQQNCVKDLDIENICNVKKCKGDVFMYSEKDYPSITLDEIPDTDDEETEEEVSDIEDTEMPTELDDKSTSFTFGDDVAVLDDSDLSDSTEESTNISSDFSTLDDMDTLDDLGDLSSLASFDSLDDLEDQATDFSNTAVSAISEDIVAEADTELPTEYLAEEYTEELAAVETEEEIEEYTEEETEEVEEDVEELSEKETEEVSTVSNIPSMLNVADFSNDVIQGVTDSLNLEIQQAHESNSKRLINQFEDDVSTDIADAGYWVAVTTDNRRLLYTISETAEFFKEIKLPDLQLNGDSVTVAAPRTEVNNVLTEIYVPKGIQFNGDHLLCNCVALRYVYFGWDTKELGKGVCFNDVQLADILFGETCIEHIPTAAFAGCKSLTNFDTEGVKTIGDTAFAKSGVQEVDFATVTDVGALAFAGCEDLLTVSNLNISLLVKWKLAAQQYNACKQNKIDSETVINLHLGVFADCKQLQITDLAEADKILLKEAVLMFP